MALKNMTYSLYSKIALWLVLNLVLLAVLGFGIGWYVLLGNGLVPAHFFSSNIENSFRLVSVNLQYRSVFTWQKLLKQYDRGEALRFHLRSLETGVLYDDCIPEKVIQAAMAIPKSSFTLCPDPDMQLWDSLRGGFFDTQQRNMEAGLPPMCVKTCPTGAMVFDERDALLTLAQQRLAAARERFPKAHLVDVEDVSVIYLLAEEKEHYYEHASFM